MTPNIGTPPTTTLTLTPGTVAMNEEVVTQDGQVNRVRVAFNGSNQSVRYAS